jgi:hypothetical protein
VKNYEIEKIDPFPHALVPNAKDLDSVFESWKEAGLTPTEVSEDDLISEIKIEAGKHNGQLKWSVKKADGINALGLMAIAMRSMFQEYLQDGGRHKLATDSPDTKIAIQLSDNKVQIAYDHKKMTTVKGILMASLWKILEETEKDDIHPLDKFTGELIFEVNQ